MTKNILTILEARVDKARWNVLVKKYTEVNKSDLPEAVLGSYLVQDERDLDLWRIVTLWSNHKALDEYRKSVSTPIWILIFREVNSEPLLSISEIIDSK